MTIEEKEKKELAHWANDPEENPDVFGIYGVLNKMYESRAFVKKLTAYNEYFMNADSILELGAGQGWASCITKNIFSTSTVYVSDLSLDAIKYLHKWEKIFNVNIDKSFACRSNEIPLDNDFINLIFCFQSAHHFTKHNDTMKEINRVLKPGGVCLYLSEPSCMKYMHSFAYKKINETRPNVPEDVLIYEEILKIGNENGFIVKNIIDSAFPCQNICHYLIRKIKLHKYLLICSSDFIFIKQ